MSWVSVGLEENRCFLLSQGGKYDQTMHTCTEFLLFHELGPLCKRSRHLEVSGVCTQPIQHFEATYTSPHIVLPHIETKFELSAPEASKFASDHVQLTLLLLLQTLAKHPLFKVSVEHKSVCVELGEELWDLLVLLH